MKSYKGLVVQKCYIEVTVEVEDSSTISEISYAMQELAETDNGEWDSETFDITEITNG